MELIERVKDARSVCIELCYRRIPINFLLSQQYNQSSCFASTQGSQGFATSVQKVFGWWRLTERGCPKYSREPKDLPGSSITINDPIDHHYKDLSNSQAPAETLNLLLLSGIDPATFARNHSSTRIHSTSSGAEEHREEGGMENCGWVDPHMVTGVCLSFGDGRGFYLPLPRALPLDFLPATARTKLPSYTWVSSLQTKALFLYFLYHNQYGNLLQVL